MMTPLRTKPSFHNSSHTVSLRSTSPGAADAIALSSRSRIVASAIALSSVCGCGFGEQQIVNLLFQPRGTAVLPGDAIDVRDLGLDAPGMRRQQQDAVADLDRFRDRMGNEQHGESGFGPELQQLVLAGAPGQRIQRRKRLVD